MHELWSSASYEPHLLSLLFALAPAAMLIVIAYAAVMRGAPTLRGFLLSHCFALLPYATVMMLSPSITSPAVAEALFRVAGAFVPMAGATGAGFQIALLGKYRQYRWAVWFLIANALIWVYIGSTGHAVIDGVRWRSGFWYAHAGPWAWLALLHTLVLTLPGFLALGHVALTSGPSEERRQLRAAWLANFVTYTGLVDVTLAYGADVFPLGWLLSGIGSLLVVRALIVEDLLRVRAVDTGAPLLVVYFATGALLAWVALAALAAPIPWPLTALALVLCFAAVRVSVATVSLVNHGGRSGEGPLDRLLAQFVGRARSMTAPPAIAQLAVDIIELGLGVRPNVLLASQADWGWSLQTGVRLDDVRAPDPLLAGWLAEWRDAVFAGDLEVAPLDLRELLAQLFASHHARAIIPVGSADELLGLVVVPAAARRLRGPAISFLVRAAERLAEALLHARLALRAAERAALAREVALAATVQAELLPGQGPHVYGDITVVGSWQPATRCAGDFWTVRPLGEPSTEARASGADDRPVLIVIGDVTGHGVASAMVTAAAVGTCDVCVRRGGQALDLAELIAALDATVRRVGGGGFSMTCFAAILDPARHEIRFVSCGHNAPYLCRSTDKMVDPRSKIAGGGDPDGFAGPTGISSGQSGAGPLPRARSIALGHGEEEAPRGIDPRSKIAGGGDPDGFAGGAGGLPRGIELQALVGRGNPLGAKAPGPAKLQHRPFQPGDLVVWYTDGVVDAQDPAGIAFGDRRLQHLLKKLDRQRLTPLAVHDLVHRGIAAHRAGRPLADDETLVVAQLAPAREAPP